MKKLEYKAKKREEVKQEPEIEYNNYEEKFYTENAPDRMPEELNRDIRRFLAAVDRSKGIRRKVTRMYRIKALDFLGNPDKPTRKEFLTVVEDWYGKRADGTEVPPVSEHKNGVYNELRLNNGVPETTNNLIYYIPFSKETVDEYIDNSWSTDQETIQFWVDTKRGSRRKQFDYDDFVTKKWDELEAEIDKPRAGAQTDGLVALIDKQQKQIEELVAQLKEDKKVKKSEKAKY